MIIIGGGPAGATAALLLARAGVRTMVFERSIFPRFHIGESLLPRNFPLLRELGLAEAVERVPHVRKLGVTFALGDGSASMRFSFDQGLLAGSETMNVERASFDQVLLDAAREAGAEVHQGAAVDRILKLAENEVVVELDGEELSARHLIDASGQATVVARHLNTRQVLDSPHLRKVAYFAHFEGASRPAGPAGGDPYIVMCEEGWFWMIPIDERRTSVGLVIDAGVSRSLAIPANQMLAWGIERCPAVRQRMEHANGPGTNDVIANFSYRCRPCAGPGYFLVGDACAFVDPIFSTGVCLAMIAARQAAQLTLVLLRGATTSKKAGRDYARFVGRSTSVFFRLIEQFYDPSFRELFLNGTGPMQVHRAVLSVLAGQVFPSPPWALQWRLRLFDAFVVLNRYLPLVPRQKRFSLLAAPVAAHKASQVSSAP